MNFSGLMTLLHKNHQDGLVVNTLSRRIKRFIIQGSQRLGKSWKTWKMKNAFSRPGRIMVSMYITYISFSAHPPHGQWPAPMGSWWVFNCEILMSGCGIYLYSSKCEIEVKLIVVGLEGYHCKMRKCGIVLKEVVLRLKHYLTTII